MLNKPLIAWALLLVVIAGLALGTTQLMRLRFESGDVYPPYSSLRSDPLGAKIFLESVDRLPGFSAERNFRPPREIPAAPTAAVLFLGISPRDFTETDFVRDIHRLAADGHRVVVTIRPLDSDDRHFVASASRSGNPGGGARRKLQGRTQSGERQAGSATDLPSKWDLQLRVDPGATNRNFRPPGASIARRTSIANLPDQLEWHSDLRLQTTNDSWRTIYQCEDAPVLVERTFKAGTIVLSTDSYFLSNEAMYLDRHPALLAWISGTHRLLTFDESHFGIMIRPGIAGLARKYRLHGLVAGLFVLAALFIWKNTSPLVPPDPEPASANEFAGKDANSGFVNLLRRNIPPSDVVIIGYEQWKRSAPEAARPGTTLTETDAFVAAEKSRSAKDRDPIALYQTLAGLLIRSRKTAKSPAKQPINSSL